MIFPMIEDLHLISGLRAKTYVDKMRGGQKMSVFVQAQGLKTLHAVGRGLKNGKILSTYLKVS